MQLHRSASSAGARPHAFARSRLSVRATATATAKSVSGRMAELKAQGK
jgi:hypothetical protein